MFKPGVVFRNLSNMGHMWTIVDIAVDDKRLRSNRSSKKASRIVTCLLIPANNLAITHDSYFVYGMMHDFNA